jgi:tRNA pseudouridine13 synthase
MLEKLPRWMGFERTMIEHLLAHPDDHVGAFRKLPANLQLMTVHALQSIVFNKSLHQRIQAALPLTTPVVGDIVGRVDEKGQLDVPSCVVVDTRTLSRIARNCEMGRLMTTGPLPGSDYAMATGEPGKVEHEALVSEELDGVDWAVEDIPRLSTTGTRRGLVAQFDEFSADIVPIADARTMGARWESGPAEGDRWHPDGACVRFRFTLSSGSYATVLLREFIQGPLSNM